MSAPSSAEPSLRRRCRDAIFDPDRLTWLAVGLVAALTLPRMPGFALNLAAAREAKPVEVSFLSPSGEKLPSDLERLVREAAEEVELPVEQIARRMWNTGRFRRLTRIVRPQPRRVLIVGELAEPAAVVVTPRGRFVATEQGGELPLAGRIVELPRIVFGDQPAAAQRRPRILAALRALQAIETEGRSGLAALVDREGGVRIVRRTPRT